MEPFLWTCPFCDRHTTITESDYYQTGSFFTISNVFGNRFLDYHFIVCPNKKCKQFTLSVALHKALFINNKFRVGTVLQDWKLIPPSNAKPFPNYIPEAIRNDYTEACLILSLSPKASATLSRRCLQGMIRDFWGVTKANLKLEIDAIQDKVDKLTWRAIDGVRKVGNIGAHMEEDISLIIDVDPEEASKLIWLIELLLREWYIARNEREERLKEIEAIGHAKDKAKSKPSRGSEAP